MWHFMFLSIQQASRGTTHGMFLLFQVRSEASPNQASIGHGHGKINQKRLISIKSNKAFSWLTWALGFIVSV
jgi:hypothetical protein